MGWLQLDSHDAGPSVVATPARPGTLEPEGWPSCSVIIVGVTWNTAQ